MSHVKQAFTANDDFIMQKTFILGVGAQRTGSTWLHSQIAKNPQIHTGLVKEHHVFNVIFTPYFKKYEQDLRTLVTSSPKETHGYRKKKRLLSFINDPENYFNYFEKLCLNNETIEAVADITPAYSMLDHQAYSFIRHGLEKRGFNVKVVFVMRDPVERVWSMMHQKGRGDTDVQDRQIKFKEFTSVHSSMRTRYDRTIVELEKVFAQDDIFYAFYETFFNQKSFSELEKFLALNLAAPDFDLIKNESHMKKPINEPLAIEAANYYAETYEFIANRFGDKATAIWPGYRHLQQV